MRAPLVADTGGLLRALERRPDGRLTWPDYAQALQEASAVLVPALVLAEVDYFLARNRAAMRRLVAEIFDPTRTYEFVPLTPADLVRGLAIDARFPELALGLVDGTVAAVAERRRTWRVLTSDRRDFSALRVGERWRRALVLVP